MGIYPDDEGGLAGPLGPSQPWEPDLRPYDGTLGPLAPSPYDGMSGSGTASDQLDPGATSVLEANANILGGIEGIGEVMSAGNLLYHGGSAIYGGITGDRDGAIAHGTQAAVSMLGLVPGAKDVISGIDGAISHVAGPARAYASELGIDPSQVPASTADIASFAAVAGTNAIFGADDSNWIAEGDAPTGTRGGEIAAGADALALGLMMSTGVDVSSVTTPAMLEAAQFFGSDLNGPTSGVRNPDGSGSYAQQAGDFLHTWDWDRGQFGAPEQGPPIEVPVVDPSLPPDLLY